MPQTGFQKLVFAFMMAPVMVYGMEVYNALLRFRTFEFSIFTIPLNEMIFLSMLVIFIETIIGGPISKRCTHKIFDNFNVRPELKIFIISSTKVIIMCPLMSLSATIIFKGFDGGILGKWLITFLFNLPMAYSWQLLAAGPLVRGIFRLLFIRQIA